MSDDRENSGLGPLSQEEIQIIKDHRLARKEIKLFSDMLRKSVENFESIQDLIPRDE